MESADDYVVCECIEEKINDFVNFQFLVLRGSSTNEYQLYFVELLFMNPYD